MRHYELTLVFRAEMEESARTALLEKVTGLIPVVEGDDVPELTFNHWGRRELAYPIKKLTDGYYILVEGPMVGTAISEFERNLSYEEDVLRHLVVLKES